MNIAILNEFDFNEEHIDRLRRLGQLTVYGNTQSEAQSIQRMKGAEIAIVGDQAPLNNTVLGNADGLKLLAVGSTGLDFIDLEFAAQKGIRVAYVPGFSTEAVAEHTIALMFAVIKRIPLGDKKVRERPWEISGSEDDNQFLGFDIKGKTLGVLGLGSIGTRVVELGLALGMKVVAYNRTPRRLPNVESLDLDEVLKTSDVVSVNLALTPETENIISERAFGLMKSSAVLVNTARGPHVNTRALYTALKERKIFGAGLDMLAEWDKANPLLELDNVVLSPHSAWWTQEARLNLAETIVSNVESFVRGEPVNLVG